MLEGYLKLRIVVSISSVASKLVTSGTKLTEYLRSIFKIKPEEVKVLNLPGFQLTFSHSRSSHPDKNYLKSLKEV